MKFSEIRIVTALMLLCISGMATANLTDLDYSGSNPVYACLTDVTVIGVDTTSVPPMYPEMASNPVPSNGAVNVSVDADLGWTIGICEGDHFEQEIYMATDPDDLWSGFMGTTDLDFFELGTLQNNTTYYWRIDTVCTDIVFMGDTWKFTTEVPEPATLILLAFGALMVRRKQSNKKPLRRQG
jgi:hypothetical protein